MIAKLQNDSATRTMKRNKLVGKFHSMEVIVIGWRVFSRLFITILVTLLHDISEQDFFNPLKDQNIQK
jgi:hypothetical protein